MCWRGTLSGEGCPQWLEVTELCDGSAGPVCIREGYYGAGSAICSDCYSIQGPCDACAPGDIACALVSPTQPLYGLAASGTNVAVATANAVLIFDATLAPIATTIGVSPTPTGFVGVPGGWLVATTSSTLVRVAADGTVGGAQSLPADATSPAMAYGPGGRALLAWISQDSTLTLHVTAELVDATGAVAVAPFSLFEGTNSPPSVSTDGTSFFVGQNGFLAKVAPDGTFIVQPGFPSGLGAIVSWGGPSGWYVAMSDRTAQRFDGAGMPLGTPFQIATGDASTYVADGDDLVGLRAPTTTGLGRLLMFSTSPLNAGGAAVEIGVGVGGGAQETLARAGADLLVGWIDVGGLMLARVASPPPP